MIGNFYDYECSANVSDILKFTKLKDLIKSFLTYYMRAWKKCCPSSQLYVKS